MRIIFYSIVTGFLAESTSFERNYSEKEIGIYYYVVGIFLDT